MFVPNHKLRQLQPVGTFMFYPTTLFVGEVYVARWWTAENGDAIVQGNTNVFRDKFVPAPVGRPLIPGGLIWDRTWFS